MAVRTSGQLRMTDIVAEFGGTAPHSLSEYYRGGPYVPDSAQNSGVPASGQLRMSDFYGAANRLWQTTITNGYQTRGALFSSAILAGFGRNQSTQATVDFGAASDATVDFLGGAALRFLGTRTTTTTIFEVAGNRANSGFTTLKIGALELARADASHIQAGGNTRWQWVLSDGVFPFGTPANQVATTSVEFL